jgi:CRISPR-associated protein Csc2
MTDSCFSIRPYAIVTERKTFNVIDEKEQTSGTVTKYDYTKPQTLFPSVVTTVDLTLDEFVYVLTNILRTARYGKEVTRQGEMENHILSIAFSDAELFSNLEFTQAFYDVLLDDGADLTGSPLSLQQLLKHTPKVIKTLTEDISGRLTLVVGDAMIKSSSDSDLPDGWEAGLDEVLKQVRQLNQDEERLASFLKELNRQAASFTV